MSPRGWEGDLLHAGHSGIQDDEASTLQSSALLKLPVGGRYSRRVHTLAPLCFGVTLPNWKGADESGRVWDV